MRCIDLAKKLGAPRISTEPGGPLEGISREEGISYFLAGLNAVEKRARDKGIKILIEPEPGLLIENSSQFLEIYKNLDPAVFGLNFDIGHFFCVGEDPSILVQQLKISCRISTLRISRLPAGITISCPAMAPSICLACSKALKARVFLVLSPSSSTLIHKMPNRPQGGPFST